MELSSPQADIYNSTKSINLSLFGKGSGKTHLIALIAYRFIFHFPHVKGFIAANTYDQLNTSTFIRFTEVLKEMGITEYSKYNEAGCYVINKQPPQDWNKNNYTFITYNNIMTFKNGATIFLGSLDNAKAHEGKEFGWAVLDETKDSKEDDVRDTILTRLRETGIYIKDGAFSGDSSGEPVHPMYIMTSPAKVDWLNKWFKLDSRIAEIQSQIYSKTTYFKSESDSQCVVIASTHHNPKYKNDTSYIANLEANLPEYKIKSVVYADPFTSSGGEYASSFVRTKHVGRNQYNPSLTLHLSFDFNTVPYNTCTVWQIEKKNELFYVLGVDEFCLENPHNSTEEVCRAIMGRYGRHKNGVFVYGDASGKNRTGATKENRHHYAVIATRLQEILNTQSYRVPSSNPPIIARRDFINVLMDEKYNIRLLIGENMPKTIDDFSYTKQGTDGNKDKHRVTDKESGISYEKYGHTLDSTEYFLCEAFRNYFERK